MRIRKNPKLSSMLLPHGTCPPESLQAHVCQLNQSPWDVINFSPDTFLPSSQQLDVEDGGSNGNGSFESVVMSMEVKMEEEDDNRIVNSNDDYGGVDALSKGDLRLKSCVKKSLHCKNKEGNKGEGHPSSRKKNNNHSMHDSEYNQMDNGGFAARTSNARRGGRPRKTASSKSNSIQFYYYSGFGPSWGKRRSERVEAAVLAGGEDDDNVSRQNAPSSSNNDNGEIDYVDSEEEDDDDDENDGGDSDKKRMRKPVKARSLKSLM